MERLREAARRAQAKLPRAAALWGVCFLLVMLYVGTDFTMEYSVDTYAYAQTQNRAGSALLNNGRPLQALAFSAWDSGKFTDAQIYAGLFWAGVALFATAVFLLQRFFARDLRGKVRSEGLTALLLAFLIAFNPMAIEYFLFIETGVFALAAALSVAAFLAVQRFFEARRARWLALGVLLELLSAMAYPVCAGLFVALSLVYILKRAGSIKAFFWQNAVVALAYGLPMLAMLAVTALVFKSERLAVMMTLPERLRAAVSNAEVAMRILPNHAFQKCVNAMVIVALLCALATGRRALRSALSVLYVCAGVYAVGILPQLAQPDTAFRMFYPLGAVAGVLLLFILKADVKNGWVRAAVRCAGLAVAAVVLVLQYGIFQEFILSRYAANQTDRLLIRAIEGRIERYEQESGERVTKVAFYSDQAFRYEEYAFSQAWSDACAITVYTGRELAEIAPREEYAAFFASRNWDAYSEEQLIFDGDELHLCRY